MSQAYRVPAWLEQSANAPGVDPKAIELHKRLNDALERGDTMEAQRLMRELNHNCECATDGPPKTIETKCEPCNGHQQVARGRGA